MLLQITNNCNEGCEHCLQNSLPEKEALMMMSNDTFDKAVRFAAKFKIGILVISGGEPTLHPKFYDFCKYLNFHYKKPFTVVTNGMWIENEDIKEKIRKILNFNFNMGIQVYSNEKYYKNFKFIEDHEQDFKSLGNKLVLDLTSTIYMSDLGRARDSEKAQEDVKNNPYFMSCLNSHLCFKQSKYPNEVGKMLMKARRFCTPCVDWQGYIHMSESCLCPHFGSVNDRTQDIFNACSKAKPCGNCKNFKHFIESETLERADVVAAREILGV